MLEIFRVEQKYIEEAQKRRRESISGDTTFDDPFIASRHCPIALCMRDNGYPDVWVGNNTCRPYGGGQLATLPEEAKAFIKKWDSSLRKQYDELIFTMEIPERTYDG